MNISIVQRKETLYKNGKSPLFLKFTQKRKKKFLSLGISLLPKDWDNTNQKISSEYSDSISLQLEIDTKLNEYKRKIQKLEILDIAVTFETLLEDKKKFIYTTIEEFFLKKIEQSKELGKLSTASKYKFCLSSLQKCNKIDIRFDEIDLQYLQNFEIHLTKCGNSSNTIATKLSVFKAIYNHAINENIFQSKDNPFVKIKVGKYWKDTRKRAITKDDVIRLKELDLTKDANTPYLEFARDIFLFSYYTAGINFKDIATLKVKDIENNYLYYVRHKTSKKIACPILNESKAIMAKYRTDIADDEDYIFPILDKNIHLTEQQIYNRVHKVLTKINLSLKLLSTQLGLKYHLTTYVARHTYATVLKNSGVSVALISEALGHSDLATTQIYLDSFDNKQVEEAMNCLL